MNLRFVRSGSKTGSGGNCSTTHNELISGADTGGNLPCYNEETGQHEGAFYIGTLAIAVARHGSAAPSISSRCGRLHCVIS